MISSLLRDTAIYGVAGILARATSLLLLPILTRLLSPAEIGGLDLLTVLMNLVNVTIALEISQGLARYYADANDPDDRDRYAATAFWFTAVAYSVFGAIALLVAPAITLAILGEGADVTIVQLAAVSTWLGGLFLILLNVLRYGLKPAAYGIASVCYTVVSVGVSIALVAGAGLGLAGVFAGQIVGMLVGSGIALASNRGFLHARPDRGHLITMLRFSIPLVPSSLGVFVFTSIDRIMVNRLMGLDDVGVFGVGYRIAQSVSLLLVGFQLALTPLIYQRYREASTPGDLALVFRYFVGIALLAWTGLSIFAPLLVAILATGAYDAAAGVIPFLVPAVLLANMYIFAPGMAITGRTGPIALLNLGAAVLNTVLNFVLIPPLGIVGAGAATFVSATCLFGASMVLSQRLYPVPHHWVPLGLAAGVCALAIVLVQLLSPADLPGLAVRVAVLGLVAVTLAALRLVRSSELTTAWRRLRPS